MSSQRPSNTQHARSALFGINNANDQVCYEAPCVISATVETRMNVTRCTAQQASSTARSAPHSACLCRAYGISSARKRAAAGKQPLAAATAAAVSPPEQQQPLPIQHQTAARLQQQHSSVQLPHGVSPQQLPRHVAVSLCRHMQPLPEQQPVCACICNTTSYLSC